MEIADLPAVPGVRHRTVDVGAVRLHVAEAGEGPPLLLLHGWPQHWWSWRHLIPRLAAHRRVLAPDLRGLGWSDAPPGDYAKRTLLADVVALLDSEGIERVDVIGHDWGGYVGFLLALEHPERVGRYVALDIAPPWRPRPHPRQLAFPLFASYMAVVGTPRVGARTLQRRPAFVRGLIKAGSGPDARWTREELDAYAEPLRDPGRARATSALYRTFLTRELPASSRAGDRSGELRVPTLLVLGAASPLARLFPTEPTGRLHVATVPRAGHFLPEEAPDAVLALAEPFLAGGLGARGDASAGGVSSTLQPG